MHIRHRALLYLWPDFWGPLLLERDLRRNRIITDLIFSEALTIKRQGQKRQEAVTVTIRHRALLYLWPDFWGPLLLVWYLREDKIIKFK